ncbi:MAG: aldo/keto reductase [Nitrospinota bacterium]
MDRRDFLKSTVAATGAGLLGAAPKEAGAVGNAATSIRTYTEIGKTGLKMSDIGFGCGQLPSSSILERGFDMGINYFDTAPDYGFSEILIGKFLQKRKSERSKMIITSKICDTEPYPAHLRAGQPPEKVVSVVEDSLKRLNTDYLDFVFVHALAERRNDTKRFKDDNLYEGLERLKKAGKIRFTGFSSHGDHDMEKTVQFGVDTGRFDMMMVAFNFRDFPRLMPVIKKAYANGMGVLAMKTLGGAKHTDLSKFKKDGASFEQAALRWVNSHKEISGAVITITNVSQLRNYVGVSGSKLTKKDAEILNYYAKVFDKEACRFGCGDCLPSCTRGVEIPTVMRYNMYFENYTNHAETAITKYAALEPKASACALCADKACEAACTYGLPVHRLLKLAHENLSVG